MDQACPTGVFDLLEGQGLLEDVLKSTTSKLNKTLKKIPKSAFELIFRGVWGTVCDDTWGKNEARVVCRQLGYTDGIPFKRAYYGQGSGRIWMDDVVCTGLESALRNCRFPGWGEKNCDHTEDAGVFCYGK